MSIEQLRQVLPNRYSKLGNKEKKNLKQKIRSKALSIFSIVKDSVRLAKNARKLMGSKRKGSKDDSKVDVEFTIISAFTFFLDSIKIFICALSFKSARDQLNSLFSNLREVDYKKGSNNTIDNIVTKLRQQTKKTLQKLSSDSVLFSIKPITYGLHTLQNFENEKLFNSSILSTNHSFQQTLNFLEISVESLTLLTSLIIITPSTKTAINDLKEFKRITDIEKQSSFIHQNTFSNETNDTIKKIIQKAAKNVLVEKIASASTNIITWILSALTIISSLVGIIAAGGLAGHPLGLTLTISVLATILAVGSMASNLVRYIYKNFKTFPVKKEIKNLENILNSLEKLTKEIFLKIEQICTSKKIKDDNVKTRLIQKKIDELERIRKNIETYTHALDEKNREVLQIKKRRKTDIHYNDYHELLHAMQREMKKPYFQRGYNALLVKINPSAERKIPLTAKEATDHFIATLAAVF